MQLDLFNTGRVDGKPLFVPRPYQVACRQAVTHCWKSLNRALVVVATGLGKTEIAAELVRIADEEGLSTLTAIPFLDLTAQTAARYRLRGIACGVEQGELRSNERHTVACYASLLSRERWTGYIGRVQRIIVDEVHLNYTKASMQMLDGLMGAGVKVVGMTATPERLGDPITDYYGKPCYVYNYYDALNDGWLVPAKIWMSVMEWIDLSKFRVVNGDFDQTELRRILSQEKVVQAICSLIEQYYEGLPSVVFCQSIWQAEGVHKGLARRGIWSSIIHSKMKPEERRLHLRDFEEGNTKIIINVGCLCVGWDSPMLRKLFICKPTMSRPKYNQMFGRLVRALPGVVDGKHSAEQRKAAIAASDKPDFELFDLTDSSRHNDLRCAVEVLAPYASPELVSRVKRAIERKGGVKDIDPIIEEEQAAMAREQAAKDAMTERLRAGLIANGRFTHYERDMNATAETPDRPKRIWTVMPFGRFKGVRIKSLPRPYVRILLREHKLEKDLRESLLKRLEE